MRNTIRKIYHRSPLFQFVLEPIKRIEKIWLRFFYKFLSDEVHIKLFYKRALGRNLNLTAPELFTEKIQWLKLYDRNNLKKICADKIQVRNFVTEIIGENHIIPLLYTTENPNLIPFGELPSRYIIKTNHGSGTNIIINDNIMSINEKEYPFNKKLIIKTLKKWLVTNYYDFGREWQYKDIKPMVLIEPLLKDESGNEILNDYKVHCFGGKAKYIQLISDRIEGVKETWFDTNWNYLDLYYYSKNSKVITRPRNFEEIIKITELLAKDFIYVRIDLYSINGNIFFGEMTFHPAGGFMKFVPKEWDLELGKLLIL